MEVAHPEGASGDTPCGFDAEDLQTGSLAVAEDLALPPIYHQARSNRA